MNNLLNQNMVIWLKNGKSDSFKFFKGNALIEIGYHKKTNWDVHLMYRF